jgi:hypothetical protein
VSSAPHETETKLSSFGEPRPEFSAALEPRAGGRGRHSGEKILEALDRVRLAPGDHLKDPIYGRLAEVLAAELIISAP